MLSKNGEPMTKDCSFLLFLTIRGRHSVSDLSEWSDLASNQTPFDQERRPGSDDAMRTSSKTLLFFFFSSIQWFRMEMWSTHISYFSMGNAWHLSGNDSPDKGGV